MAESALNDAVFRLPDQFLTDDDLLFDKENAPVNCKSSSGGGLETTAAAAAAESLKPSSVTVRFPMEFPYEFDSALSSPVDSVVCSTETETETENSISSDEEDFLAGLTRRLTHSTQKLAVPGVTHDKLEKSWVMSGSPESTLSGIGSWSMSSSDSPNGSSLVSSPPATPFSCQNDTWDLISAAAGQVARLKMSNEALNKHNINSNGRGLIAPPKTTNSVHVMKNPDFVGFYSTTAVTATTNTTQSVNQNKQLVRNAVGYHENTRCGGVSGGGGGRPLGLSQSAWPPLQAHPVQQQHTSNTSSNMRAVFLGGSGGGGGVKRECAGTGVFLPRRYGNNNNNINNFNNNPHDSRKKLGCSTVLLPAKVVQALNLNFEDIHSHVQAQQIFNGGTGIGPNYDALMARRNALLMLQKRSLRAADPAINHHHHEQLHLPQDWTY
ncbi:hypothetical protein EZV62_025760 [Acer yangbiense]|uniref:Uncharacterized protein n=1 Tax=Acer yangbiense TaxID=1000413 RepID=A0A5C7GZF6_9ROSI|nr:hypothetical protein EZV62_025760 [Acer yangbiense]